MDKVDIDDDDDDIPTPSTSRSNSINEDEERPSSTPAEETVPSEFSPPKDTSEDVTEQVTTATLAKRTSFVSTSSSSEGETDFVAVNKNDYDPDGSIPVDAVSLLTG